MIVEFFLVLTAKNAKIMQNKIAGKKEKIAGREVTKSWEKIIFEMANGIMALENSLSEDA